MNHRHRFDREAAIVSTIDPDLWLYSPLMPRLCGCGAIKFIPSGHITVVTLTPKPGERVMFRVVEANRD